jgi:23S rRNA (guanosine2251-2'-O)-methyltransferase
MSGKPAPEADRSQVYGIHAVSAVVQDDPGRVRAVYLQRGRHDNRLQAVIDAAREAHIRVEVVDKRRLDRLTGGSHQGVAADCHELQLAHEKTFEARFAQMTGPRLILVLDGVTDPRNLGACLRSADAAGVQAVLLPKRRSAPLNPAALKTAAGGAEALFLVQVSNLARRLEWLRDQGVWVIGAAGAADGIWLDADFAGDAALVVGSEGKGLRALTAKCCDQLVRIPMSGAVSSLNVSVATGILLFEARRQRGLASG